MKLTPKEELREGLWFARKVEVGEQYTSKKPWAIVLIFGTFPFLDGRVVVFSDDIKGENIDLILRGGYQLTNPNEWEFGERIEFPTDE